MSLRLNKYIKELRKEAHRFERTDINNDESKTFLGRNQRRIICLIPSLAIFLCLDKGFSPDFVAYASTAISILIGLFTTSIIFILDKYDPINARNQIPCCKICPNLEDCKRIETQNQTSREKLWDTQAYNYTKQFAYITGYNIVLCVFSLVLLSMSSLFKDVFSISIWEYKPVINNINIDTLTNAFFVIIVILQRFFTLYWLASIIYNTLYAISSMVKYIIVKMDRQ